MFAQIQPHVIEHAALVLGHYFVWVMFFCSLGFYAAATYAALRFQERRALATNPEFTPHVSILKPVHGVDFGSGENFASFCDQNYPSYEILFAVNDESDPAVPLVRKLIQIHPERKMRLVTGAPFLGENRKVNNLAAMARDASHEFVSRHSAAQSFWRTRGARRRKRFCCGGFSGRAHGRTPFCSRCFHCHD